MSEDLLILVDEHDNETGVMSKIEAHTRGLLHRAFSVFIFNSSGEFLLQQRAFNKYHSSGLWSNACCSHPRPGEDISDAAHRRLHEEMGIRCRLAKAFSFLYKAHVGNNLMEHEIDHVFVGVCDETPKFDRMEVAGWRYLKPDRLSNEMLLYPQRFTEWFKICVTRHAADIMAYKTMLQLCG